MKRETEGAAATVELIESVVRKACQLGLDLSKIQARCGYGLWRIVKREVIRRAYVRAEMSGTKETPSVIKDAHGEKFLLNHSFELSPDAALGSHVLVFTMYPFQFEPDEEPQGGNE